MATGAASSRHRHSPSISHEPRMRKRGLEPFTAAQPASRRRDRAASRAARQAQSCAACARTVGAHGVRYERGQLGSSTRLPHMAPEGCSTRLPHKAPEGGSRRLAAASARAFTAHPTRRQQGPRPRPEVAVAAAPQAAQGRAAGREAAAVAAEVLWTQDRAAEEDGGQAVPLAKIGAGEGRLAAGVVI
jgi:hypothetical protein